MRKNVENVFSFIILENCAKNLRNPHRPLSFFFHRSHRLVVVQYQKSRQAKNQICMFAYYFKKKGILCIVFTFIERLD